MTSTQLFRTGLSFVLASALAAAACSDDKPAAIALAGQDAGADAVASGNDAGTSSDASPSDAKSDAKSPTLDGALSTACTSSDLCFDVSPVTGGATPLAGRVVVLWYQLNDDGPDPVPEKGFEAPFAGTETTFGIPLAQITPPTEPNLLCARDCDDEAVCACKSEPKVGTGLVVVMLDQNQNGTIDIDSTAKTEPIIGVARMMVAYSDKAFSSPAPFPYDRIFPDGIEKGVRPYDLVRPEAGSFDRFGKATGNVWPLKVCDTLDAATCNLPFPNAT